MYYKVGDLVMFQYCAQQGQIGMIKMTTKHTHLAKSNPDLAIYWVFHNHSVQCFTGSQLVLA